MANNEHVRMLREDGIEAWNTWRKANPEVRPNLVGANLSGAYLVGANFSGAHLFDANLVGANLREANLKGAHLRGVNLVGAHLFVANLSSADLSFSDLSFANLVGAHLVSTHLLGASLRGAILDKTVFVNVDLSGAKGLEDCCHYGPSSIDRHTLGRSGELPLAFRLNMLEEDVEPPECEQ